MRWNCWLASWYEQNSKIELVQICNQSSSFYRVGITAVKSHCRLLFGLLSVTQGTSWRSWRTRTNRAGVKVVSTAASWVFTRPITWNRSNGRHWRGKIQTEPSCDHHALPETWTLSFLQAQRAVVIAEESKSSQTLLPSRHVFLTLWRGGVWFFTC